MKRSIAAAAAALSLAAPAAADAHVTLNPRSVTANSFGRLDVRVPTERDDASTRTVVLIFPDGFYDAGWKRVIGWKATVRKVKLATPVQTADGPITERVDRITWRARTKADQIAPGSFEEFGLSMRIPDVTGTLTFKALQYYSSGEIVRWTGAPGSETPAPTVTVTR
jgi:periplasmic copper chaperone A